MMIDTVPPHLVEDFWPAVEPLLKRSLAYHPFLDVDDLRSVLLMGRATLFVVVDEARIVGTVVMETCDYPKMRVGNVIALAGISDSLTKYGDDVGTYLDTWCRQQGCAKIGMLGRPGWARFVGSHGWQTMPFMAAWKDVNVLTGPH